MNHETLVETRKYRGLEIEIHADSDPLNPRTECDNLGTMICGHKRYDLGDKHDYRFEDYAGWEGLRQAIIKEQGPVVWLPIYLYDHSGITINTTGFGHVDSDHWDWGCLGFIFITHKEICKEYGWKRLNKARTKKIEDHLRAEVGTYDNYLTGDVYGYEIKGVKDGSGDSCWGFFGSDHKKSGLLEQAENAIDCTIKYAMKQHIEKLKAQIRVHTPLNRRVAFSV